MRRSVLRIEEERRRREEGSPGQSAVKTVRKKEECQIYECLASVSPAGLQQCLRFALLRRAALGHSCSFTTGTKRRTKGSQHSTKCQLFLIENFVLQRAPCDDSAPNRNRESKKVQNGRNEDERAKLINPPVVVSFFSCCFLVDI